MKKKYKNTFLIFYSLRDMIGVYVAGIPFRIGEFFSGVIGLYGLFTGNKKIRKTESTILWILMINFILSVIGIFLYKNINVSFAIKYLARNFLNIVFILGFLCSNISFTNDDIEKCCSFFVVFEFILFIITELTGVHVMMNNIYGWNNIIEQGQYIQFGSIRLVRFMGSASEAGYLAPMIAMPLWFYLNSDDRCKSKKIKISMIIIMSIFTFSTAVYMILFVICLLFLMKNINNRRTKKTVYLIFICAIALLLMSLFVPAIHSFFQSNVINKIKSYLGNSNVAVWSSIDRIQHLSNAWKMFIGGNIVQMLIGHGTGAYYAAASINNSLLVSNVEEAYNLFLSTLTDRGIIGFILLMSILAYSNKMVVKGSIYSEAIYMGICAQFLHWLLVGNFWLYYFWYEIVFLIGYRRYELCEITN